MRNRILASAALSLVTAAFVPGIAKADDWHRDHQWDRSRDHVIVVVNHDEWRHEHWHHEGDTVSDIDPHDVPNDVSHRVDDYRHGRHIEYAQVVHHDGETFYRFRINDPREGDFYLHIAPNGHLITRVDVAR